MISPLFTPSRPLVLVGCGNMGRAMLAGWHTARAALTGENWPQSVWVIARNPETRAQINNEYRVQTCAALAELPKGLSAGLVVLAVKPQQLEPVLTDISACMAGAPVVSVAAGKTLSFYSAHLPAGTPIIRAMPNTPSLVGMGITGCIANEHTQPAHRDIITTCFSALGLCCWLAQEDDMHRFTALCGSGPAFLFYLLECLHEQAAHIGVAPDAVIPIMRQLCKGALALAEASDAPVDMLRQQVTSPAGVTAAGLEQWMSLSDGLAPLLEETLARAARRSRELSE